MCQQYILKEFSFTLYSRQIKNRLDPERVQMLVFLNKNLD